MPDGGWLIPGLDPLDQRGTRQLNRAVHSAAEAANIDERVSMHTLRHCFATHLLEQKVDTLGNYPTWIDVEAGRTDVNDQVVCSLLGCRDAVGLRFPSALCGNVRHRYGIAHVQSPPADKVSVE